MESDKENQISIASSSSSNDKTKQDISPELSEYINSVHQEKVDWVAFARELKKKYLNLKKSEMELNRETLPDIDFLEYLPEKEKEFLQELRRESEVRKQLVSEAEDIKKKICGVEKELKNQKLFLIHFCQSLDAEARSKLVELWD